MLVQDDTRPLSEFVPADRCDRCGARAMVRAIKGGTMTLELCNHHAGKANAEGQTNRQVLEDTGWFVYDNETFLEED